MIKKHQGFPMLLTALKYQGVKSYNDIETQGFLYQKNITDSKRRTIYG